MYVILFQSYSVQNVKNTKMLKAGKKLAFTENFLLKVFQIIDALLRFLFPHCVQNRYILMKGADFESTSLLVALAPLSLHWTMSLFNLSLLCLPHSSSGDSVFALFPVGVSFVLCHANLLLMYIFTQKEIPLLWIYDLASSSCDLSVNTFGLDYVIIKIS